MTGDTELTACAGRDTAGTGENQIYCVLGSASRAGMQGLPQGRQEGREGHPHSHSLNLTLKTVCSKEGRRFRPTDAASVGASALGGERRVTPSTPPGGGVSPARPRGVRYSCHRESYPEHVDPGELSTTTCPVPYSSPEPCDPGHLLLSLEEPGQAAGKTALTV